MKTKRSHRGHGEKHFNAENAKDAEFFLENFLDMINWIKKKSTFLFL